MKGQHGWDRGLAGRVVLAALLLAVAPGCGGSRETGTVVTFPGSTVGAEAQVLRRQLARFMKLHPDIRVVQRETPDAADQRHQLYVQWLNARASEPDILQLDVIWTPEFAAAGWILPLDRFEPDTSAFFPATVEADTWRGSLYGLPWFVDVGMLYWRTDLLPHAPATFDELFRQARQGMREAGLPYGFVWQGARYEGLVTVFLEFLGGYGGRIMDASGRITVDSPAGIRALTAMRASIASLHVTPEEVLTWHEEETRFAFQNGQAVFMRNWPYAYPLMEDSTKSKVAGRFAVAPMPAEPGGHSTAALGGSQLAINARSRHPEAAWAVIDYLTQPAQMLERAEVAGQYPTRVSLYDDPRLAKALAIPPAQARAVIAAARPRPVTPVYTQLSETLQIQLHRALTGQAEPAAALHRAAAEMRELLKRTGLAVPVSSEETR
jgi:multiple sugar transport system substrate-binding protein